MGGPGGGGGGGGAGARPAVLPAILLLAAAAAAAVTAPALETQQAWAQASGETAHGRLAVEESVYVLEAHMPVTARIYGQVFAESDERRRVVVVVTLPDLSRSEQGAWAARDGRFAVPYRLDMPFPAGADSRPGRYSVSASHGGASLGTVYFDVVRPPQAPVLAGGAEETETSAPGGGGGVSGLTASAGRSIYSPDAAVTVHGAAEGGGAGVRLRVDVAGPSGGVVYSGAFTTTAAGTYSATMMAPNGRWGADGEYTAVVTGAGQLARAQFTVWSGDAGREVDGAGTAGITGPGGEEEGGPAEGAPAQADMRGRAEEEARGGSAGPAAPMLEEVGVEAGRDGVMDEAGAAPGPKDEDRGQADAGGGGGLDATVVLLLGAAAALAVSAGAAVAAVARKARRPEARRPEARRPEAPTTVGTPIAPRGGGQFGNGHKTEPIQGDMRIVLDLNVVVNHQMRHKGELKNPSRYGPQLDYVDSHKERLLLPERDVVTEETKQYAAANLKPFEMVYEYEDYDMALEDLKGQLVEDPLCDESVRWIVRKLRWHNPTHSGDLEAVRINNILSRIKMPRRGEQVLARKAVRRYGESSRGKVDLKNLLLHLQTEASQDLQILAIAMKVSEARPAILLTTDYDLFSFPMWRGRVDRTECAAVTMVVGPMDAIWIASMHDGSVRVINDRTVVRGLYGDDEYMEVKRALQYSVGRG